MNHLRTVELLVDGESVAVEDRGQTLLDLLREDLGHRSVKDGCSPQGQCGCCTVLVDGKPRVACVTPARRVRGRAITTFDGLDPEGRQAWIDAFVACGASQCGFCTPGIICRLEAARQADESRDAAAQQLMAHLCRCTGWQPILDAYEYRQNPPAVGLSRDEEAAGRRATLEGGEHQVVGPDVVAGRVGFAADTAPPNSLVAVLGSTGDWVVAETLAEARAAAGKVQGRRTTAEPTYPVAVPEGAPAEAVLLQTTWTEPAYLETDASWCEPGGQPASPLINGGAFGAKRTTVVAEAARRLADLHRRPVLAVLSREDTVRLGPKRPPVGGWVGPDGRGRMTAVATPGWAELVRQVAPGIETDEVDVVGPATSCDLRTAGWLEPLLLVRSATGRSGQWLTAPDGGRARAHWDGQVLEVEVDGGELDDEVVVRSYALGAVHFGASLVASESLSVDDTGEVCDLTIRSFGILRARDLPPVELTIASTTGSPRPIAGAVAAAVAEVVWVAAGRPERWPTGGMLGS